MLPGAGIFRTDSESMLEQLDKVIADVVRVEITERDMRGRRVSSYPYYYDYSSWPLESLNPDMALCLYRRTDFIAASALEFDRAKQRLAAPRKLLHYWVPLRAGSSLGSQSL